ncbi:MAG: M55 family metallopeptidase, partial [Candidatus Cloacimonetes bacterium]|nr:M55 family metallopeptidase [Candidatus Cloacimonadota bacterium]
MPLLDESFDLVFLVGYHAGTGALQANMDHTYSNSRIQKISINGRRMNEALINAAYAGVKGVPVALVTGDLALQKELMDPEALPWVHYVCTKEGVSKFAALNYNQIRVKRNLVTNVQQALRQNKAAYPLFAFSAPVRLEIEFHSTAMADMACLMPYTKRLDGRSIEYVTDDYPVLFEAIMALVTLAYATGI